MSKKLMILLVMTAVLVGLSGSYIIGGLQAYSRYQQASLDTKQHCGGRAPVRICVRAPATLFSAFYPSYIATHSPVLTVFYSSANQTTLLLNVNIVGFSQVETHTVNATTTLQALNFTPPPLNGALNKLTADENVSLHIQATDMLGHLYYDNDILLLLHSRWLMQWLATNRLQIAAWVTPNDPAIKTLVDKTTKRLQSSPTVTTQAMIGYSNATHQQVLDQVNALYDTLRLDYTMHYIEAAVPYSGPGDTSASLENIKLPAEVLKEHGGMCIELTALLASAVERIGLHAEIVITQGHAFLGVAATPADTKFEYWDAVQINNNVAGESANIATDSYYTQHSVVDTILISDARKAGVGPMI